MIIAVLGANGNVGSRLCGKLLERGHTVLAYVHTHTDHVPKGARAVHVNISDQTAFQETLAGVDAVICTMSSWKSKDHSVLSTAMQTIIPAMQAANVKRLISISGDIAILPGEKPRKLIRIVRKLMIGAPKKVIADSEDHIRQIVATDLDWTIIRPGIMTSSSDSSYHFSHTHGIGVTIPRAAVVAAIVDLVETNTQIHEAPFLVQ